MRIVLLGPPGAGKGSLAQLLKDGLGLLHISTGDILREEMKNQTDIGKEAKSYIENGELVPDEVVTKLIEKKLTDGSVGDKGYMLDGFPRTKKQAESLDNILMNINQPLDYVINLEATIDILLKRLTGRRVCKGCGALFHMINKPSQKEGVCDLCCGVLYQRADDNEKTIKNRMDVYWKSTKPMIDYYDLQGKIEKVDGNKETDELEKILMQRFHEDKKVH